jgi:hypothetical protein
MVGIRALSIGSSALSRTTAISVASAARCLVAGLSAISIQAGTESGVNFGFPFFQ